MVDIPHSFGQAEVAHRVKDLNGRIIEATMLIKNTRNRLKDYLKYM
jgi:hypothetical protein